MVVHYNFLRFAGPSYFRFQWKRVTSQPGVFSRWGVEVREGGSILDLRCAGRGNEVHAQGKRNAGVCNPCASPCGSAWILC